MAANWATITAAAPTAGTAQHEGDEKRRLGLRFVTVNVCADGKHRGADRNNGSGEEHHADNGAERRCVHDTQGRCRLDSMPLGTSAARNGRGHDAGYWAGRDVHGQGVRSEAITLPSESTTANPKSGGGEPRSMAGFTTSQATVCACSFVVPGCRTMSIHGPLSSSSPPYSTLAIIGWRSSRMSLAMAVPRSGKRQPATRQVRTAKASSRRPSTVLELRIRSAAKRATNWDSVNATLGERFAAVAARPRRLAPIRHGQGDDEHGDQSDREHDKTDPQHRVVALRQPCGDGSGEAHGHDDPGEVEDR